MMYITFILGRLQAGTSYIQSSAWPFQHNANKVIYSGLALDIKDNNSLASLRFASSAVFPVSYQTLGPCGRNEHIAVDIQAWHYRTYTR